MVCTSLSKRVKGVFLLFFGFALPCNFCISMCEGFLWNFRSEQSCNSFSFSRHPPLLFYQEFLKCKLRRKLILSTMREPQIFSSTWLSCDSLSSIMTSYCIILYHNYNSPVLSYECVFYWQTGKYYSHCKQSHFTACILVARPKVNCNPAPFCSTVISSPCFCDHILWPVHTCSTAGHVVSLAGNIFGLKARLT